MRQVLAFALATLTATLVHAGPFGYIANMKSGNVSVIDTTVDMVVATVPVGYSPWGVAVGPGGERVYVSNSVSNSVSVIRWSWRTSLTAP